MPLLRACLLALVYLYWNAHPVGAIDSAQGAPSGSINPYLQSAPGTVSYTAGNSSTLEVSFYERKDQVPIQGATAVLIESLREAYVGWGKTPDRVQDSFVHSESAINSSISGAFNVRLTIKATSEATGDYRLTRVRIVDAIGLLGFDLSRKKNAQNFVAYDFDIKVFQFPEPERVIAKGSLTNFKKEPSDGSSSPGDTDMGHATAVKNRRHVRA